MLITLYVQVEMKARRPGNELMEAEGKLGYPQDKLKCAIEQRIDLR